ncbi:MAG: VCBS repeat-containing protein [Myxococcales bacterium]|nr:VCBS repeat-containing protein [Myxococcales bacterium]
MNRRTPLAVIVTTALLASACRSPATSVEVIVETDADPLRRFELRVCTARAGETIDPARCTTSWTHGGAGTTESFYASFGVRPPPAWNGADLVDVLLLARVEATTSAPAVSFSRRLRFGFVRGATTVQRVFLPVRCGAPSDSCTRTPLASCTISAFCEERSQTCNDDAVCVDPTVTPAPRDAGASTDALPPRRDVVTMDVLSDSGIASDTQSPDVATDQQTVDAPDVVLAPPPVLLSPRAGEVVRGRRPTFRWSYGPGLPAHIRVCTSRTCDVGTIAASAQIDRWTASVDLPTRPQRLYWQVAPFEGGSPDYSRASVMRQLWVSGTNCAEPPALDIDDNGAVDLSIGMGVSPTAPAGTNLSAVAGYNHRGAGLNPWPSAADALWVAGAAGTMYGGAQSVADFDGDGRIDLVIAEPGAAGAAGHFVVVHGSGGATRMVTTDALGGTLGANYGRALAALGDLDGDGDEEILAGGTQSAIVALGRPMLGATPTGVTIPSPASARDFGRAVAACDLDGDGTKELVISAPDTGIVSVSEGRVLIYRWVANTAMSVQSIDGASVGGRFGAALACGDLNGDGRDDLIVGAPGASSGAGEYLVYLGFATTPLARFTIRVTAGGTDSLGAAIAAGRDIDGDGTCDFAVGAPRAVQTSMVVGRTSIVFGSPTLSGTSMLRIGFVTGTQVNEEFGASLALVADGTGDGRAELLVGSSLFDNTVGSVGRALMYRGRTTFMPTPSADAEWVGARANQRLGLSFAP